VAKRIEITCRSTPTNPRFGYGDQVIVKDGDKDIYGGHCSTCPNPFRPSDQASWEKAYAWIAPGEYQWVYAYNPKFGRCLLINGGGKVPTRFPNSNQVGAFYATGIYIHAGGIKSNNKSWRGSRGCVTVPPVDFASFISNFKPGDSGVLEIKDFFENRKEDETEADVDPVQILGLMADDADTPDYYSGFKIKTKEEIVAEGTAKSLFKSKTFWANVISGAVVLLDKLSGLNVVPADVAVVVVTLLNIILRMVTDQPVSVTK
jgi:hypothetical protein